MQGTCKFGLHISNNKWKVADDFIGIEDVNMLAYLDAFVLSCGLYHTGWN